MCVCGGGGRLAGRFRRRHRRSARLYKRALADAWPASPLPTTPSTPAQWFMLRCVLRPGCVLLRAQAWARSSARPGLGPGARLGPVWDLAPVWDAPAHAQVWDLVSVRPGLRPGVRLIPKQP
eukprot:352630-Chlamydomonas_euryale.AAC.9